MIRDVVDGGFFIDDGSRYNQYKQNGSLNLSVTISSLNSFQDWGGFCGTCHGDWYGANPVPHMSNGACLTCHSHGGAYDGMDNDHTETPYVNDSLPLKCQ